MCVCMHACTGARTSSTLSRSLSLSLSRSLSLSVSLSLSLCVSLSLSLFDGRFLGSRPHDTTCQTVPGFLLYHFFTAENVQGSVACASYYTQRTCGCKWQAGHNVFCAPAEHDAPRVACKCCARSKNIMFMSRSASYLGINRCVSEVHVSGRVCECLCVCACAYTWAKCVIGGIGLVCACWYIFRFLSLLIICPAGTVRRHGTKFPLTHRAAEGPVSAL